MYKYYMYMYTHVLSKKPIHVWFTLCMSHMCHTCGSFKLWVIYTILVTTQALMLCLIYAHSPLDTVCLRISCVYIRKSTLTCVITYAYHIYIFEIKHRYQPHHIGVNQMCQISEVQVLYRLA